MKGKHMVAIAFVLISVAIFMLFLGYIVSWYYGLASLSLVVLSAVLGYYGFRKWDEEDKK